MSLTDAHEKYTEMLEKEKLQKCIYYAAGRRDGDIFLQNT